MHLHQDETDDSDLIAGAADYILENLERSEMGVDLAVPALGFAIALLVAGQPSGEEELMKGVIKGIRRTFKDTMAAKQALLAERQRDGTTLQ